jgi:3-methyladenine DNA glycosylase AlkD
MSTTVNDGLVKAVRERLRELANPERAGEMRAYMKSAMPFHGVPGSARKPVVKELFAAYPLVDKAAWLATIQTLWREATHREERYSAVDLAGHRPYRPWHDPDLLALHDELIVTGAWWDFVDEIAIRHIGPILSGHRDTVTPIMRTWSTNPDRWRRRTSVICQIKAKSTTDTTLLADCIEANVDDRDFFLRKGIGWALREHAKTDATWVRRFVATHPELSPLSIREALKHVGPEPGEPAPGSPDDHLIE